MIEKRGQLNTQRLNIDLALPEDAAECGACIERLLTSLRQRRGIVDAHVDRSRPGTPELCLHYQPSLLRLEQVRPIVEEAGAALKSTFEHLSLPLGGLRHERQAKLVEGVMAQQPGVIHVAVSFGARRLFVDFDPRRTNRSAVLAAAASAGVEPREESPSHAQAPGEEDEHAHEHGGPFGERSELVFSLACGLLMAVGWALTRTNVTPAAPTALFIAAYLFGSWFTLREVAVALRARRFEIDFLMLLAAIGAAVLGELFEGALLLFLFTFGHSLEGYAMNRARNAIAALGKLVPETALKLEGASGEREVAVGELSRGDRILVKPNTRIPADGFITDGTSSVDQAPITGESMPVGKRPTPDAAAALAAPESIRSESRVFAGTINGTGLLTIVVTKEAGESTLARVAKLVAEAQTQKSPTQEFTERFERLFVPIVIGLVVALLFAWAVVDEPFSKSFYRAMAVLVAASPCALAIATPSAVLSAIARAARGGVLVKGGAHLEALGLVRAIAFDKTGTLTEGKPTLVDVVPVDGAAQEKLLRVAVAVERRSDHPLASAIVAGGTSQLGGADVPEAAAVEAVVGFGVRGMVDGEPVAIGKPGLFKEAGGLTSETEAAVERLQRQGRTVMVVRYGDRFLGVLGVMDKPRESAKHVIAQLHELGVEETVMLTGDNQRVADAVARQVGIGIARGDLLPEQKVAAISELNRTKTRVAMVGDGVNDAPAMATAAVGIAMGAGGSDVALETADVALMADDLRTLPFAIGLGRAATRVIRQNLWASLGMVAFLIPATIFGFAGIGAAVALHEGSTLVVVANALRLLAYKGTAT